MSAYPKNGVVKDAVVKEDENGVTVTGRVYKGKDGKVFEDVTATYPSLKDNGIDNYVKVPIPNFRNLLAGYGNRYTLKDASGKRVLTLGELLKNPSLYGSVEEGGASKETTTITYTVDGKTYTIPSDKEKAFLTKYPNAKKK